MVQSTPWTYVIDQISGKSKHSCIETSDISSGWSIPGREPCIAFAFLTISVWQSIVQRSMGFCIGVVVSVILLFHHTNNSGLKSIIADIDNSTIAQ